MPREVIEAGRGELSDTSCALRDVRPISAEEVQALASSCRLNLGAGSARPPPMEIEDLAAFDAAAEAVAEVLKKIMRKEKES